jgi:hypothetical protein
MSPLLALMPLAPEYRVDMRMKRKYSYTQIVIWDEAFTIPSRLAGG